VSDAAASGTFTWNPANGQIAGTITVHAAGRSYRVGLSWTQRDTYAHATLQGVTLKLASPGP